LKKGGAKRPVLAARLRLQAALVEGIGRGTLRRKELRPAFVEPLGIGSVVRCDWRRRRFAMGWSANERTSRKHQETDQEAREQLAPHAKDLGRVHVRSKPFES